MGKKKVKDTGTKRDRLQKLNPVVQGAPRVTKGVEHSWTPTKRADEGTQDGGQ
jgi:hypothetical protein